MNLIKLIITALSSIFMTTRGYELKSDFNLNQILHAIATVESGNNSTVVNVEEDAVGLYQIRRIYVDDVNRILDKPYFTYGNRVDPIKSRDMVVVYITYYGGRNIEKMVRCHNGGPDGWRNSPVWFMIHRGYSLKGAKEKIANTITFWNKIKNVLENTR